MITIYDVAKHANCSPATVSKAFNHYSGVSKKTYDKIMQSAEALGYTPNNNARALVTKKTWLIGVLFSEELGVGITHPHYSEILQNFRIGAEENGYDIIFVSQRIGDKSISYLEHCNYRGVDGVLLAVSYREIDSIRCILDSDIKCVSVEDIYPNHYTIIADNRMGTIQALNYLYLLGHRKIAHIAGPLKSVAGLERSNAYFEFMQSKGLSINPKHYIEAAAYSYEAGKEAAEQLLQQAWDDVPTAIYVYYDDGALAAISAAVERGYRVPQDISIIGFDNLKVAGYGLPEHSALTLTTIEQDRAEIGRRAADVLVALIEGRETPAESSLRVPTKLIVRNSCTRQVITET